MTYLFIYELIPFAIRQAFSHLLAYCLPLRTKIHPKALIITFFKTNCKRTYRFICTFAALIVKLTLCLHRN